MTDGYLRDFIQFGYNRTIRPHMPRKLTYLNGVVTRNHRLLDMSSEIVPWFKANMMEAIREYVRPTDMVVDVGGGYGVASIVAARHATDGHVYTFEPASKMVEVIEEAIFINQTNGHIRLIHGYVGEPGARVYGELDGKHIPVSRLPYANVLLSDCEGGEDYILQNLRYKPRVCIIEAHPEFGTPVRNVTDTLSPNYELDIVPNVKENPLGNPVVVAVRD